jgi:hypothetical protein
VCVGEGFRGERVMYVMVFLCVLDVCAAPAPGCTQDRCRLLMWELLGGCCALAVTLVLLAERSALLCVLGADILPRSAFGYLSWALHSLGISTALADVHLPSRLWHCECPACPTQQSPAFETPLPPPAAARGQQNSNRGNVVSGQALLQAPAVGLA